MLPWFYPKAIAIAVAKSRVAAIQLSSGIVNVLSPVGSSTVKRVSFASAVVHSNVIPLVSKVIPLALPDVVT